MQNKKNSTLSLLYLGLYNLYADEETEENSRKKSGKWFNHIKNNFVFIF